MVVKPVSISKPVKISVSKNKKVVSGNSSRKRKLFVVVLSFIN